MRRKYYSNLAQICYVLQMYKPERLMHGFISDWVGEAFSKEDVSKKS